ncbi:MAG: LTA synthase family protein [bacterium]|nr:LTA synthase family protein [bacterium]
MKMNLKYAAIYLLFGLSIGCLCSFVTSLFKKTINKYLTYLFCLFGCLIYCIEMECKMILQTYYQLLSSAETAANNNLLDYKNAILTGITGHLLGLLLFLLPFILLLVLSHTIFTYQPKRFVLCSSLLGLAVLLHLGALGVLSLSWSGDAEFLPKNLYASDKNVEDQVESLGVFTMLRLDIKHSLFGVNENVNVDEDFNSISDLLNAPNTVGSSPSPTAKASPSPSSNTEKSTPEPTKAVDTSPNVMDIDFSSLASKESNDSVKWLDRYFDSVEPTKKNEYTGMFKGYNVIFLSAEGFSGYMIDKKLTPTLYKLTHEAFVFHNFYTPLHFTSTSGGEFQNLVGLYPKNGNPISMTYTGKNKTWLPFTLANQLDKLGYNSQGYHCNVNMYGRELSHPNLGYDWHQSGSGVTMEKNSNGKALWPQSDEYLFKQTVDEYINKDDPFNVYYMTISGHLPYSFDGDQMAAKNKDKVKDLPYSDKTKAYIAANLELENGLTYLINALKKAGKLENTVICMTADHIPYSDVDILEELSGKSFHGDQLENLNEKNVNFDVYKNSLILWSGSMKDTVTIEKPCSQIDILPTLSNLLGLEYDSRLLMGTDILSDSSPFIHFSSNCWLTDKGLYNRFDGTFTLNDDVEMSAEEQEKYVTAMKKIASYKLKASELILTTDYYNTIPALKK